MEEPVHLPISSCVQNVLRAVQVSGQHKSPTKRQMEPVRRSFIGELPLRHCSMEKSDVVVRDL